MELSSWIQLGAYILGLAIGVAVLKNDIKWLGKSLDEHKLQDAQNFEELKRDVRDIRNDWRE